VTSFPYYELFFALASYVAVLGFAYFARMSPPIFGNSRRAYAKALFFLLGSAASVFLGAGSLAQLQGLQSGFAFYGGLLGFALFAILFARGSRLSVLEIFDRASPSLAMAHAVGRVGCFLEGCCYGTHCDLPWAVTYDAAQGPLHPVQLYESIFLATLGFFLWKNERLRLQMKQARPSSTALYLIIYAPLRFALEFFRGDETRGAWEGLSSSQWISIPLFAAGVVLILARRRSR
jgi:phosphatidylglycerol:prolipoprotein diacylglycerol transferase